MPSRATARRTGPPPTSRARMDFALRCAYAHGTGAIRTHLDSIGKQTAISWPVFAELREAWRGRDRAAGGRALPDRACSPTPSTCAPIRRAIARASAASSAASPIWCRSSTPGSTRSSASRASEGLDLDFHVDETQDPAAARSLRHIAETALRYRFAGQVTVGHCCSLARQRRGGRARDHRPRRASRHRRRLPADVQHLPAGPRTPAARRAGAASRSLHELKAAGVTVAVSPPTTPAIRSTPMATSTRSKSFARRRASPISTIRSATGRAP